MLQSFEAVEPGGWLRRITLHRRQIAAHPPRHADERSAGSESGDKVRENYACWLMPGLRALQQLSDFGRDVKLLVSADDAGRCRAALRRDHGGGSGVSGRIEFDAQKTQAIANPFANDR